LTNQIWINPPQFDRTIDMTKDNGIAIHKIIADEARRTEQVYLYSDMSKYCEGVGCAWLAIEPGVTDKP